VTELHCKECNTPFKIGSLFCDECGRNLLADRYEEPVEESQFAGQSDRPEQAVPARGEMPATVEFVILNSGRRVTLPLGEEIRIGRADPNKEIIPEVDLSDDDGAVLGVSRLHASLQSTENGVILVDLGSTNGTFLHEENLTAHESSCLESGDTFRLGEMQVQVFFELRIV
jgi:pSer/pThr/pTyr-binding forkhead associated (FHA) protein